MELYLVKCEICALQFTQISTNHLRTHNTTLEEYKLSFPNSTLIQPEKLEDWHKNISKGIEKHWSSMPQDIKDKRSLRLSESNTAYYKSLSKESKEEKRALFLQASNTRWAKMSNKDREEFGRLSSEKNKNFWLRMTPQERELRGSRSTEGFRNYYKTRTPKEAERVNKLHSEYQTNYFLRMSPKERNSLSNRLSNRTRDYMNSLTQEELNLRNKKISETLKEDWLRLPPKEKIKRLEALARSSKRRPTIIEQNVLEHLDSRWPGDWLYNGNPDGLRIGVKTPDFIRSNGTKQVIEVLGGLGYFHSIEDESIKIDYYRTQGYKCVVILEPFCSPPWDEVDRMILEMSKE